MQSVRYVEGAALLGGLGAVSSRPSQKTSCRVENVLITSPCSHSNSQPPQREGNVRLVPASNGLAALCFSRGTPKRVTRRGAVIVASQEGEHSVKVKLSLTRECYFGQRFFVTGGTEKLGSWNPAESQPLDWTEGNVWTTELELRGGSSVEYKIVLVAKSGAVIEWQPGPNRVMDLSKDSLDIVADWDQAEVSGDTPPEATVSAEPETKPEPEIKPEPKVEAPREAAPAAPEPSFEPNPQAVVDAAQAELAREAEVATAESAKGKEPSKEPPKAEVQTRPPPKPAAQGGRKQRQGRRGGPVVGSLALLVVAASGAYVLSIGQCGVNGEKCVAGFLSPGELAGKLVPAGSPPAKLLAGDFYAVLPGGLADSVASVPSRVQSAVSKLAEGTKGVAFPALGAVAEVPGKLQKGVAKLADQVMVAKLSSDVGEMISSLPSKLDGCVKDLSHCLKDSNN